MDQEYLLVNAGVNVQKFERYRDFNLDDHPELIEALDILPNGEICGILKSAIEETLNDYKVSAMRNGLVRIPRHMDMKCPEDFLKFIAINIDIEEY